MERLTHQHERTFKSIASFLLCMFMLALSVLSTKEAHGQVAIMQYRHVADENMQEFVHRETTYWSQIAQKAIDEGKMEYWAMWQKVGGWNLDEGSNFLFINVFKDKSGFDHLNEVWDGGAVFPEISPANYDTYDMSTVKHMLFVESIADAGDTPPKYLRMNYGKVHDQEKALAIEMRWKDFIDKQIAQKKTDTTSWRLARVLAPTGASIPFDIITMDGFQSLSDAVYPTWAEDTEFPDMSGFDEAQTRDRVSVYALVKAVGGGD